MEIKNKIKFLRSILLFIILILFFKIINPIDASEIFITPSKASYQVGDTVKLKVVVNSDVSINAVSSYIKFSNNILNLSSFYKGDSLVSFWAKEPSFSNTTSYISFDGVILNGFSGQRGNILSINFKAIKEGEALVSFESASVLANDGLGTETLTNKNFSTIKITKVIPKIEEKPKEGSKISEVQKEVVLKIREIEEVNQLPVNLLVILFGLLIILILIIIIIIWIRYIKKTRKYLKNKIFKSENELKRDFDKLEEELNKEIIIISGDKKEEKKDDEIKKILEINKRIEKTEKRLLNNIENLKKDS
jgi:predicted Holliday junction resolvase-like endonuclease